MGQHSGSRVIAGGLLDIISPQKQLFLHHSHTLLSEGRDNHHMSVLITFISEIIHWHCLSIYKISVLLQWWLNAGDDGNRDYWSYVTQFIWVERRWVWEKKSNNLWIFGKHSVFALKLRGHHSFVRIVNLWVFPKSNTSRPTISMTQLIISRKNMFSTKRLNIDKWMSGIHGQGLLWYNYVYVWFVCNNEKLVFNWK